MSEPTYSRCSHCNRRSKRATEQQDKLCEACSLQMTYARFDFLQTKWSEPEQTYTVLKVFPRQYLENYRLSRNGWWLPISMGFPFIYI